MWTQKLHHQFLWLQLTQRLRLYQFLFSPKFNDSWQGKRLALGSLSLVNSLLGRDSVADQGHKVTRALFRKIVNIDL